VEPRAAVEVGAVPQHAARRTVLLGVGRIPPWAGGPIARAGAPTMPSTGLVAGLFWCHTYIGLVTHITRVSDVQGGEHWQEKTQQARKQYCLS
jgi:hypothetical protein